MSPVRRGIRLVLRRRVFSGGSLVDDYFGGCSGLAAEEAPGGVAGAFEPQAHLGVGGHPVFPDDAVAAAPSAGADGVLAVAVLGYQGG